MVAEANSDNWRILDLSYASVFQNLALEEALARSTRLPEFRPTVRCWVNSPSVVLGRFQETSSEVDVTLCEEKNVQIGRRFTGGGAVFHDKGNLNFTIVTRRKERITLTELHEAASSIVLDALRGLGLKPTFLSPNSILIGGRKVTGAAAALGRDFAVWHSSTLVSTNVDTLKLVLAPSEKAHGTRFVRSRWQPVTTLQAALGRRVSLADVKAQLMRSVENSLGVRLEVGTLSAEEDNRCDRLYRRKYSLPAWNVYGNCGEHIESEEGIE
jgi:lipoate-protein ligase A